MRRTDFHFDLPAALIACHPAPQRSGSRLLPLEGATGALTDRQFRDLPGLLRQGDLLGIYPEGTRSPDGRLYRGRTGPARMSLAAPAPVKPP